MPLTHVAKGLLPIFFVSFISACTPVIATGTSAANLVQLQDRSIGATIDDATIYGRITDALIALDSKEAYRGVSIDVFEGRVLLTGQVRNPENAEKTIRTVWAVQGVREVINEIQIVSGNSGPFNYANDSIVTAQAKSRLVAERGIASGNYKIETVNGVVYVMGKARNDYEHKQAMNVISRSVGARKVVSHVRVPREMSELAEIPPGTIPPL
ncbi:MAG: BON domain-containing protein [Alphaproteobacteria bacterium]|nr:BON domain-containing protein [Alphaproteobacteria bacterium]